MRTITWEVKYPTPPNAHRYCKKCGEKMEFQSSDCFRVNANQKALDVWLIYRCTTCKTTWNLTLLSRVNPKSIPKSTLQKFMDNDHALAHSYAMDSELLSQNGAETHSPEYTVSGEAVDFSEHVKIVIKSDFATKIKLSKVIRSHLGLSNSTFKAYIGKGLIKSPTGKPIEKMKLQVCNEVIVTPSI